MLRRAWQRLFGAARTAKCPPRDWRDVEGWDRYWRGQLASKRGVLHDLVPHTDVYMTSWWFAPNPRNPPRVLFAGNGISMFPHIFARAGSYAVALDISRVASNFLRQQTLNDDLIARFFVTSEEEYGAAERAKRPGGQLEIIAGDLFDANIAPGPFDLIISERALQGFVDDDVRAAVRALDQRLAPDGEIHVWVQNWEPRLALIRESFLALGYEQRSELDEPGVKGKRFLGHLAGG